MKKTIILIADGFEEIEALTVVDILRRLDIACDICALKDIQAEGAHGIRVIADKLLMDADMDEYDAVILPGGMPGTRNLKADSRVVEIIREFNESGKLIAAICAAPTVLKEAGITKGLRITSFPGYETEFGDSTYLYDRVVQDKNIITSRGPGTAMEFAFKIAENFVDDKLVNKVKKGMLA